MCACAHTRKEWSRLRQRILRPPGDAGRPTAKSRFPTDSIISLLCALKDGASTEIAVVGNDGAIGVALFMGVQPRRTAPLCQAMAARTG